MDTNRLRAACWVLAYSLLYAGCLLGAQYLLYAGCLLGAQYLLYAGCSMLDGCLLMQELLLDFLPIYEAFAFIVELKA